MPVPFLFSFENYLYYNLFLSLLRIEKAGTCKEAWGAILDKAIFGCWFLSRTQIVFKQLSTLCLLYHDKKKMYLGTC